MGKREQWTLKFYRQNILYLYNISFSSGLRTWWQKFAFLYPKYKKLFSQARSSRFFICRLALNLVQILSKEFEFEITYTFCNQFS